MLRGGLTEVIWPKLALVIVVAGLPRLTWLKALNRSAWTFTAALRRGSAKPLRNDRSNTWYAGPTNWPRRLLPRRVSGAAANCDGSSHTSAPVALVLPESGI